LRGKIKNGESSDGSKEGKGKTKSAFDGTKTKRSENPVAEEESTRWGAGAQSQDFMNKLKVREAGEKRKKRVDKKRVLSKGRGKICSKVAEDPQY